MPYSYHESTTLSKEDAIALKSLGATGELPKDHYWNALREKHDANPTRFDKGNYVLAALLDRDQLQREGVLSANAPLFSKTGFFSYAGGKHTLDMARFDHWHPFLGRLFEIVLPTTTTATSPPAGETLGTGTTSTPSGSTGSTPTPLPPSSGMNGGTTNPPSNLNPSAAVPEPASALMMGVAIGFALAGTFLARKFKARGAITANAPVVA